MSTLRQDASGGRWRFLLATLLAAGALGFSASGIAQEADRASVESDAGAAESAAEGPSEPSSEVFIPTEEISEDFAVSFPVDI